MASFIQITFMDGCLQVGTQIGKFIYIISLETEFVVFTKKSKPETSKLTFLNKQLSIFSISFSFKHFLSLTHAQCKLTKS